jgi:hypothetical protein
MFDVSTVPLWWTSLAPTKAGQHITPRQILNKKGPKEEIQAEE